MRIKVTDHSRFELPDFSGYALKPDGQVVDFSMSSLRTIKDGAAAPGITIDIEATASGVLINGRTYSGKSVKAKHKTFVDKPILRHHDQHADAIGRIVGSRWEQYAEDLKLADASYTPAYQKSGKVVGSPSGRIVVSANITDPDAVQKVLDRRYNTASSGAFAERACCSVCGACWTDGDFCEHVIGDTYKVEDPDSGKKHQVMAFLKLDIEEYIELSFVNTPAWREARVLSIENNEDLDSQTIKNFAMINEGLTDSGVKEQFGARVRNLTWHDALGTELTLIRDGQTPKPITITLDSPVEFAQMENEQTNETLNKITDELKSENTKLVSRVQILTDQIGEKDSKLKDLRTERDTLQADLDKATTQIADLLEQQLKGECSQLADMLEVLGKTEFADDDARKAYVDKLVSEGPDYVRGYKQAHEADYKNAITKAKDAESEPTVESSKISDSDVGALETNHGNEETNDDVNEDLTFVTLG